MTSSSLLAGKSYVELEEIIVEARKLQEDLKKDGLQALAQQFEAATMAEFGMTAQQLMRAARKLSGKSRRRRRRAGSDLETGSVEPKEVL